MQHRYDLGLALVLLAVCLVWACNQPLPTAPEDPVAPLAVHSDTPGFSSNASAAAGSDTYSYTGSGDLNFPDSSPAYRGAGKNSSQVNLCAVGCDVLVVFSKDFVDHWGDWQNCFGDATGRGVPLFAGILRPDKKNPNGVRAQFWFQGKGTGGVKEFTYQLASTGTVSSGTFPPAPGDLPAIIEWKGASGVMLTEGKGKGSKGRNAGTACTGPVTLDTSITLEGVS